jgi:CRP/FNR family transcriptional regulator
MLTEDELEYIGQIARLKSFARGETLFTETSAVEFIYIVKDGSIKLYKTSEEGRELTVRIMGPGDYFCCAPIHIGGKHFVNATAVLDSEILAIPAKVFKERLFSDLSDTSMRIINGLCGKIKYLSGLLEELTFKGVEQRVIITLLRRAEDEAPGGKTATLSLTHQDIAALTGTVREVVSRTMLKLKKEGIITDTSARGFTIDKDNLLRFLNRKYPSI